MDNISISLTRSEEVSRSKVLAVSDNQVSLQTFDRLLTVNIKTHINRSVEVNQL